MSVNKAMIIGRLGRDPELKTFETGRCVARLNVATDRCWKTKTGELEKRTDWHKVVIWGKDGENAHRYLRKGRQVYVEGRLETRSWDDKDGVKRYITELVAKNVQYLDGHKREEEASPVPVIEENALPF